MFDTATGITATGITVTYDAAPHPVFCAIIIHVLTPAP